MLRQLLQGGQGQGRQAGKAGVGVLLVATLVRVVLA